MVKSFFSAEVNVPQARLAELYADPDNNAKWMTDLERCQPISGEFGMVGSKYRFVPKAGGESFVATVLVRDLPKKLALKLEAPKVTVNVVATLTALSSTRTKFRSAETFEFAGLVGRIMGFAATAGIRRAHQQHMRDFVRFAEKAAE